MSFETIIEGDSHFKNTQTKKARTHGEYYIAKQELGEEGVLYKIYRGEMVKPTFRSLHVHIMSLPVGSIHVKGTQAEFIGEIDAILAALDLKTCKALGFKSHKQSKVDFKPHFTR